LRKRAYPEKRVSQKHDRLHGPLYLY
jgi:hypothetical protein